MNSTELIESCKKVFQEYHEERESFEEGLMGYLYHKYHITVDRKDFEYFLTATKSWHWRSFYNGYLEGATQYLKNEQNRTT